MASKSSRSGGTISVDAKQIDELLSRGVAEVYPNTDALRLALASGKRLRVYAGIDPTAPTLHIGHLAVLQKLRQFQALGHEVILLIGDFTGMIGDPTGKSKTRVPLTREQVDANAAAYREQASAALRFDGDLPATIRRNSEWWDGMAVRRFLELLSLATVQQLLERDMFQERVREGKPIAVPEFLYPALQGYDSVAMSVDVEVGATDQTFNMLTGREFVKKFENREKFVLTVPLITDAAGQKIGKTTGNMVELGAAPNDLFGQAMALPDSAIVACLAQATAVTSADITAIGRDLAAGGNPRDAKMRLAHELVLLRYGAAAADAARDAFVQTFQQHEVPADVETKSLKALRLKNPVPLSTVLVRAGLASSTSDARRLMQQGGVRVDGETFRAASAVIDFTAHQNGILIQKGKRHFVRVTG